MYKVLTSLIVEVGKTRGKLPPSPFKGRKEILIQNVCGVIIYLGGVLVTSDTASTGGFQLLPRAGRTFSYGADVDLYAIISDGAVASTNSGQIYIEEGL